MPRLRNKRTHVVVNVDDATAAGLDGSEWRPVDEKPKKVKDAGDTEPAGEPKAPKGNASAGAWTKHAVSLGIEVPEGASRDEVKALVAAHAEAQAAGDDDTDDPDEPGDLGEQD
ncbi:hypothetical protein [Cellulomonas hominis]|uniref:hypothetical protein n=1 Tax=Cellulomonas hominis TaxID=156981 RepID=UPI001443C546|nr:hypothetical protein [Cellulomonas hominis]NKY08939.1 hypothetical protein [Cellulomonas hominis]